METGLPCCFKVFHSKPKLVFRRVRTLTDEGGAAREECIYAPVAAITQNRERYYNYNNNNKNDNFLFLLLTSRTIYVLHSVLINYFICINRKLFTKSASYESRLRVTGTIRTRPSNTQRPTSHCWWPSRRMEDPRADWGWRAGGSTTATRAAPRLN